MQYKAILVLLIAVGATLAQKSKEQREGKNLRATFPFNARQQQFQEENRVSHIDHHDHSDREGKQRRRGGGEAEVVVVVEME